MSPNPVWSQGVRLEWKATVVRWPVATLQQVVTELRLGAGFRPGKIDPERAKQRVSKAIETWSEFPEGLRSALYRHCPLAQVLSALDATQVKAAWPQWRARWGDNALWAGVWLLPLEHPLHRLGLPPCDPDSGPQAGAPLPEGWTAWQHSLEALHPRPSDGNTAVPPEPAAPAKARAAEKAPDQAEERLQRQQWRQLHQTLDQTRSHNARLEAELAHLQPALTQAQARLQAQQTRLDALEQRFEDCVRVRLEQTLDRRWQPWLGSAEARQTLLEQSRAVGLLDQVRGLLREQAQQDACYGVRQQVQAELDQACQLLQDIQHARQESLRPLPVWGAVQTQLEQHVATLRERLQGSHPVPTSKGLQRLAERLSSCTELDHLARLRQQWQQSQALGLWDEAEQNQAWALLHRHSARLHAVAGGSPQLPDPEREACRVLPLYTLQIGLARGQNATLVVDGHNVLFSLPTCFRQHFTEGQPGPTARHALQQRLLALAQRHPLLQIHLWFDGPERQETRVNEQLQVHFSGGQGDNRADQEILAFLAHLQRQPGDSLRALVTADQDQTQQARASQTWVLSPQELVLWWD